MGGLCWLAIPDTHLEFDDILRISEMGKDRGERWQAQGFRIREVW